MVELLIQRRQSTISRLVTRDSRLGFTLVEVLLAMTILAIGVLVMGGLLTRSARTADATALQSYQAGMIATEVARNDALPFSQLAAGTTCSTMSGAPLPHTLCTTITVLSAKVKQVKVKFTPTSNYLVPADSVMFERSISGPVVPPLNTP
jgi:prepilin-type N-terminal cleavage/methylation domain-containing protein